MDKLTATQTAVYKTLMLKSKDEVFVIWRRECCRSINSADIREQRKSWMAHDVAVKGK